MHVGDTMLSRYCLWSSVFLSPWCWGWALGTLYGGQVDRFPLNCLKGWAKSTGANGTNSQAAMKVASSWLDRTVYILCSILIEARL